MSIHKIYNRKLSDLTNGVDDVSIYTKVVNIFSESSTPIELIGERLNLINESYEKEKLFDHWFGNAKKYRACVALAIFDIIMSSKNMLETHNCSRLINTMIKKIDEFVESEKMWFDEIKVRPFSGYNVNGPESHVNGTEALLRIRDGMLRYMAATNILKSIDLSRKETQPKTRERTYGHMTLRTLKLKNE